MRHAQVCLGCLSQRGLLNPFLHILIPPIRSQMLQSCPIVTVVVIILVLKLSSGNTSKLLQTNQLASCQELDEVNRGLRYAAYLA